jgi:hypothetical protein
MKYPIGSLIQLYGATALSEVLGYSPNPAYIILSHVDDPKKKKQAVAISRIQKLVSSPLPGIGDRVIDEDGQQGTVINSSTSCLTIKKKDVITSHSIEKKLPKIKQLTNEKKFSRGGKREGAGRKPTGNPPKKRKALQLDESLAAKLPDLPSLAALLEEFRPIAESGQLRSQKLADFYKKLDSIPKIVNH